MDRQTCLLGLRVTLGLFCAVINGIDLAFNVYAVPLKDTFDFTQTQVEIVASMSCAGFGLAFLEILISSTFGYLTTFAVTWIGLPLTCGLFGLAAVHNHFIHVSPIWVYLIQLFLSVNNGITLTMVRSIVLGILPKKSLGTMIGLFDAAYCLGKIAYSGLLEWICHHDLAKFFFTISAASGVLLSSFYPLLYPCAQELKRERDREAQRACQPDKPSQEDNRLETESKQESHLIGNTEENTTCNDVIKSRFFHMTFWTTVMFSSASYTVLNNITSVTSSVGIKDSFNIVTLMSVCVMVARVFYGLLFDKCASLAVAFWLLFSLYLSFALGLATGLWFLYPNTVYIIGVLCGTAVGPANGLPISMLLYKYGRANLNPLYGALYFTVAVSQLVMQIITGYLYDHEVTKRTTCQGTGCFYWSFLSLLCLTVFITILQCVNYMMTVRSCSKA